MQLIRAQSTDAPLLSAIAQAAKAHWDYPPHWLELWRAELTLQPQDVAAHQTFLALGPHGVAGFYAVRDAIPHAQLEHLWVLPNNIGTGVGRALFTHAANCAAARGALSLRIEADPNAESFYLHLGAVRIGTAVGEIEGHRRELPILEFSLTKHNSPAPGVEKASAGN